MTIALLTYLNSYSTASAAGPSSTIDTTGATLLVMHVASSSAGAIPSVSDSKGNTWAALTSKIDGSNTRSTLFYCASPTVGSGHTFNATGSTIYPSLYVAAFSGTDTSSPFDVENGATSSGTSSLATGSVTPSNANSLLFYGLGYAVGDTISVSVGSMLSQLSINPGVSYGGGIGYEIQTTATARNPSFSWATSSASTAVIAVFKEPGAGGTTISATPGNAVADGTTASVTRTIPATLGNASADGITASIVRGIGASPGNAAADGTTAAVTRTIATTPGDAVADGVTATISTAGTTTISCTPGNATADGALAAITRTIAAAPGNAVANGAIAALLRVIATTPGNAVADGVAASVQGSVTIACTLGNAVADGVTATVTAAVSQIDLILKILRNRQELNPSTGKFTLYDDDGTTVLKQSNAWADVAGTRPYSGGTLARIDALF